MQAGEVIVPSCDALQPNGQVVRPRLRMIWKQWSGGKQHKSRCGYRDCEEHCPLPVEQTPRRVLLP